MHSDHFHVLPRLTHGSVESRRQISVQLGGGSVTLGTGEINPIGDVAETREAERSERDDHDDGYEVDNVVSYTVDHLRDA